MSVIVSKRSISNMQFYKIGGRVGNLTDSCIQLFGGVA